MKKPYPPIYYGDYLELDKLLDAQHRKSEEYGKPAHDEMLFIIIHQAYELWFKQIIFELDSVIEMFSADKVNEENIGKAVSRFVRIIEIQKILVSQLNVLETMSPMGFLSFRDYLIPASGFQSIQFRIVENKLGLKSDSRVTFNNKNYYSVVSEEHKNILLESEKNDSLLQLIDKWLSRIPFLNLEGFDFVQKYKEAVEEMLTEEKEIIMSNPALSDEKREKQLSEFEKTRESFSSLFDEKKHNELMERGLKKLSYKSTLSALFINLYRYEPILHMPFRFLTSLIDIDENFTAWRYKHALMVHRMIGAKVGTGGSSGHHYLLQTAEKHKVFKDLFDLTTYFMPKSMLPKLPPEIKRELGFYYTYKS